MVQEVRYGPAGLSDRQGEGLGGDYSPEAIAGRRQAAEDAATGWIGREGLSALEVGLLRATLSEHAASMHPSTERLVRETLHRNPTSVELRRRALDLEAREAALKDREDRIAAALPSRPPAVGVDALRRLADDQDTRRAGGYL